MKYYKSHKKKHKHVYKDIKDKWEQFEKQYWLKHPNEKYCHACGTTRKIELHHIIPRHIDPSKIFDENNLIPLCRCCHFRIGHLRDWDSYNPNVIEDTKIIYSLINKKRIGN